MSTCDAKEAVVLNVQSLRRILEDILLKMHHQLLGNCETLEHLTLPRMDTNSVNSQNPQNSISEITVFRSGQVDALIRNPVKQNMARLQGLKKVVDQIEQQVRQLDVAPSVSTGNKS